MPGEKDAAVPDVDDAVPLDDLILNLKKDIETDCRLLLQRARVINNAITGSEFRMKFWERRINEIRKAQITTYNVEELKQLRERCKVVCEELEEFSKKLS